MSSTTAATPENAPAYVQGQKGAGLLTGHRMREKILDAILKGESCASIARWVAPPVSRQMIGVFARQVAEQRRAAELAAQVSKIEQFASTTNVRVDDLDRFTKQAVLGSEHLSRIRAHQQRIDNALDGATDATELATLIKTDLQGVRLAAELDGSLTVNPVNQSVTQNILILPFGQPQADQPAPAIDTTAEPVDA